MSLPTLNLTVNNQTNPEMITNYEETITTKFVNTKDNTESDILQITYTKEYLDITCSVLDNNSSILESFQVQNDDIDQGRVIYGDYILIYKVEDNKLGIIPVFYNGTYTIHIVGSTESVTNIDNQYTCTVTQNGTEMDNRIMSAHAIEDFVLTQDYAARNHSHLSTEIIDSITNLDEIDETSTALITSKAFIDYVHNRIYPVGSIYITSSSSILPSENFGGTWEKIDEQNINNTIIYYYKRSA